MGANQSYQQQPRAGAVVRAQGEIRLRLYPPAGVKDLSSARFNEEGFYLVLTELKQVRKLHV